MTDEELLARVRGRTERLGRNADRMLGRVCDLRPGLLKAAEMTSEMAGRLRKRALTHEDDMCASTLEIAAGMLRRRADLAEPAPEPGAYAFWLGRDDPTLAGCP